MTPVQYVDSPTLANDTVKDTESRHNDPDAHRGYRFPIPWFMNKTGGWGRDWLCYVYGQAGIGKTSVLSTAAAQFGKDGIKFLYCAMEESLQLTGQRILSNLEAIDRTHFRDIKLTKTEWARVYTAASTLSKFNGYWTADAYTQKEYTELIDLIDPDVLIVDYLQLMDFPGQTKTDQVVAAAKFLKLVQSGKVGKHKRKRTVIVSGQLNDEGKPLYSRDPDRDADLTVEIAGIDTGAGTIMPDKRKLKIRKFRHGGDLSSTDIAFFGARSLVGEFVVSQGPTQP